MRKSCFVAAALAIFNPAAALAGAAPACNSIIDAAAIRNACGADAKFEIRKERPVQCTGRAANKDKTNLNTLSFTIGTSETDEKAAGNYASWLKAVRADLEKGDGSVTSLDEIDGIGTAAFMRERPAQMNDQPGARDLMIYVLQGNHLVKIASGSGLMGRTPMCDDEQLKALAAEVGARLGH